MVDVIVDDVLITAAPRPETANHFAPNARLSSPFVCPALLSSAYV